MTFYPGRGCLGEEEVAAMQRASCKARGIHCAPDTAGQLPRGLGRDSSAFISERRSTPSLLSPFMLTSAHPAPTSGVRMTQQVAWNKVSHRKRSLTHRRAWAAKKILGEAFSSSAAASQRRGLRAFAFQPTVHDSGPEVLRKERG